TISRCKRPALSSRFLKRQRGVEKSARDVNIAADLASRLRRTSVRRQRQEPRPRLPMIFCRTAQVRQRVTMIEHAALLRRFALLALLTAPALSAAQPDFQQCLTQLRATAEQSGVSAGTLESVITTVRQLPRVVESDRSQPEFVDTFARYLNRRI